MDVEDVDNGSTDEPLEVTGVIVDDMDTEEVEDPIIWRVTGSNFKES